MEGAEKEYWRRRLHLSPHSPVSPEPKRSNVEGSETGTLSPDRVKVALNVGAGLPPTISMPIRSQFGSRSPLRIQL